jgi:hypothetical protein
MDEIEKGIKNALEPIYNPLKKATNMTFTLGKIIISDHSPSVNKEEAAKTPWTFLAYDILKGRKKSKAPGRNN